MQTHRVETPAHDWVVVAAIQVQRLDVDQESRRVDGLAYFDRRVAEDKTKKEALRALKRQTRNTVFRHLAADAASARG